jgi:DNA repair exonuclease SbcCD nuclease subunit
MSRLSFLFRTDTHVADRSPASWKADYPSEIWSNLEQIGQFAKQFEVTAVLDGGDFFHVKAASRNPHALVERAARIHQAYPCPVWSVEGNHDIAYNNLDTLAKQPLGVLLATGVFHHLREQVFEDGGVRVRVVGVPYSPHRTVAELKRIQKKPGDDFIIAVVHALAAQEPPPNVEGFFGEPVFRYGDLVTENGPDAWCFGHWHKDQGIVTVGGKQFVNQGAVSRGALVRENTLRTPQVSHIVIENGVLRVWPVPLIVAPAEDVFDIERKEREEAEDTAIDAFAARIKADAMFDPSLGIEESLNSLDYARDVRDLAQGYLERARAEVG